MNSFQSRARLIRLILKYLRLRHQKGFFDGNYFVRSFRYTKARLFSSHRMDINSPLITTFAITSRCPLRCYHCSEGYDSSFELPADVVLKTIDELVALGCPAIALTGGEPFMRRELPEFLDRIPASVGTGIYTSGMGLTEKLAAKLADRGSLMLAFSIDHSDPDEHDRLRGRKGSHEAAMSAIKRLGGRMPEIQVSTIATRERIESGELVSFVRSLKKPGVSCVQLFQPRPTGRLTRDLDIFLRPEEEEKFFGIARDLNHDPDAPFVIAYPVLEHPDMMGCCGGYARVYIDSQGNVCPCDFAPLSFGVLTEESFTPIWKKMREFFAVPGNRCLVRDNPEVFGKKGESRNVIFKELERPETLHAPCSGLFDELGERTYRMLLPNLVLAGMVASEWKD